MNVSELTLAQKTLAFRAGRRGMLEMDRIMERFMAENLSSLSDEECTRLLDWLNYPDADLFDWITGIKAPPEEFSGPLFRKIVRSRTDTVRGIY